MSRCFIAVLVWSITVARSSEDLSAFAGSGELVSRPLRQGVAVRIAESSVLLLRAMVIVLLLSPVFLTAAFLLR